MRDDRQSEIRGGEIQRLAGGKVPAATQQEWKNNMNQWLILLPATAGRELGSGCPGRTFRFYFSSLFPSWHLLTNWLKHAAPG
jgi:hypothetical protein